MMAEQSQPQRFAFAPMSRMFLFVSAAYLVLAAGLPVALWFAGPGPVSSWTAPISAGVLWGILWMTWAIYRPRWFEVSSRGVTISWPLRRREIPLSSVCEVRPVDKADLGWMIRVFGVGGLFGAFGRFRSQHVGPLDVYASRRDGLVLISLRQGRPILITPEKPELFCRAIAAKLNASR